MDTEAQQDFFDVIVVGSGPAGATLRVEMRRVGACAS